MTFAAGDVVTLKSGGLLMTVVEVEHDEALCLWTGEDGDLFRETIPVIALEVAVVLEEDDEDADIEADGEESDAEDDDEPAAATSEEKADAAA